MDWIQFAITINEQKHKIMFTCLGYLAALQYRQFYPLFPQYELFWAISGLIISGLAAYIFVDYYYEPPHHLDLKLPQEHTQEEVPHQPITQKPKDDLQDFIKKINTKR